MRLLTKLSILILVLFISTGQISTTISSLEVNSVGTIQIGVGTTVNAVGESASTIGKIWLPTQGGSKTCSAAGGCRIGFAPGTSLTWSNVSTNLRVGIQDVDTATGLEDGTFDVNVDLVPGTDTLTANAVLFHAMDAGSKTVSHLQLVAITGEMIARAGTDSVVFNSFARDVAPFGFPYGTADTGALAICCDPPLFVIIFDDGTYGWIDQVSPLRTGTSFTNVTLHTGTTPDEIAAVVKVGAHITINGFGHNISNNSFGSFEYIIYADPLGTPSIIWGPITLTDTLPLYTSPGMTRRMEDQLELEPDTYYGFAIRALVASPSITYRKFLLSSSTGGAAMQKSSQWFTEIMMAGRVDNTGPFVETAATDLPTFTLNIVKVIASPYSLSSFPALFLAP